MYVIKKEFDFHYGHRIWSQALDGKLSCDAACKCRFLHGHSGKVVVTLHSSMLVNGMVTDFTHLKWFKQWIDNTIDHKFLIDIKDPALEHLLGGLLCDVVTHEDNYSTAEYTGDAVVSQAQQESIDSFVIVNFLPTSEEIAKWLHGVLAQRMNTKDVSVMSVEFHESPTSCAVYYHDEAHVEAQDD